MDSSATPAASFAAPYDINNPPPDGKDPADVRHNAALDFAEPTTKIPVHTWLNSKAAFCKLHKTHAPAFLASGYLLGKAAAWFHDTYAETDMDTVSWKDFSGAILNSYLIDPTANQTLLDRCKSLSQGTLSIKDYLDASNDIFQDRKTHRFLKNYDEHFFTEMFRYGLDPEIQSRLPAITPDTTYQSYTVQALHIAAPLEDDSSDEDATHRPAN